MGTLSSKVGYCILFAILTAATLFLRVTKPDVLVEHGAIYDNGDCAASSCHEKALVYRLTFAGTVFFLVLSVITAISPDAADGLWILKAILLGILCVITFFISNAFFDKYFWVAIFCAGVFIVLQLLLLVEFAYSLNEKWVEKEWYKLILAVSFVLYLAGLVLSYLLYRWFTDGFGCLLNSVIVFLNIGAGAAFTLLALIVEHGALLSSGMVFFFTCQTSWSAMLAQPNDADMSCNSVSGGDTNAMWQLLMGMTIAIFSVTWKAMRAAEGGRNALDFNLTEEEKKKKGNASNWYFHLIFGLGCCYIAMIFTKWGGVADEPDEKDEMRVDVGWTSFWVNMASVWLVMLMFVWSLIAPSVLKGRDFT
eukprot:TRINITY_DN35717_c0_g1_i1.p1 TRINITY_DN35717_c0_g1~~TRINITY_DN35717_c0_g1_i1.p1  ORF type:complete len:384 (+),score=36.82 TRINITY_DN35717_c0_g1_i1:59-1153(+)